MHGSRLVLLLALLTFPCTDMSVSQTGPHALSLVQESAWYLEITAGSFVYD